MSPIAGRAGDKGPDVLLPLRDGDPVTEGTEAVEAKLVPGTRFSVLFDPAESPLPLLVNGPDIEPYLQAERPPPNNRPELEILSPDLEVRQELFQLRTPAGKAASCVLSGEGRGHECDEDTPEHAALEGFPQADPDFLTFADEEIRNFPTLQTSSSHHQYKASEKRSLLVLYLYTDQGDRRYTDWWDGNLLDDILGSADVRRLHDPAYL